MKIKIRGLVFTGFAAAVFAQSASAVIVPPSAQDPADPSLEKTVTSEKYINENFQERDKIGVTYDSTTQEYTEKAIYVPWKYGNGGISKNLVKLDSKNQLASTSGGNNDTTYVQIVHDGKGQDGHYVELNTNATTFEENNNTGADKIEAAGGTNATNLEKGRLTTAKAVYDFVTAEVTNVASSGITGNTTYHTQKVAVFDSGYNPTGTTTNPAPADLDHVDHWELIVPDSVVAESGSDIGGTALNPGPASGTDLTTAQAVYDFVTGTGTGDGFQPKTHVDSTNGEANNSLKFGMGEGQWGVIRAYGQTSPGQTANSYLHIQAETERNTYSIGINPNKIAQHGVAGTDAGGSYSNQIVADSPSLATANAVYEYAVKQHWDSTNDVGKHLVVGSDGVVALSTTANPDIPLPTDCATGTNVCALVAHLNSAGTSIEYEWTVMAQ